MQLNKFSILPLILGAICIICIPFYFFNKLSFNYIALILGLTQLFSGLTHIKNSKNLNNNNINGSKIIGILILIIGVFLIIAAILKIAF